MSDSNENTLFWETIPGIITAIGALLTGVAALITALYTAGIIGSAKSATSSQKANTQAAQAAGKKEPPSPGGPKQGDTMIESATGMKFIYVPKGCFMMGSNEGSDDEKPVHKVCVDAFWMGQYEVTQGQWQKIMGKNPAHFQKGNSYPVEQVSWDDSQEFIKKLNNKTEKSYRLPTEAEWEYACRGNGSGKYCGGDNVNDLAWYSKNSNDSTHPVGNKQANDFGLHDMSGNVWEWCADWYDEKYYASIFEENPIGPLSGTNRILRGGGWLRSPVRCRSVRRHGDHPGYRDDHIGFRLTLPFR